MTTVRFSKLEFETALSTSADKVQLKVEPVGIVGSEEHYAVVVKNFNTKKVCVEVASSVSRSGFADEAGENSIRLWLTDEDGAPLGSKIQRWVTRVPGWEKRLDEVLTKAVGMASKIDLCPTCKTLRKVFIVKKEGKNHGRLFLKCRCDSYFQWLDEFEQPEESHPEDAKAVEPETPKKVFAPSKYQQAIFD